MGKKEGPSWEKAISVVWVETISHNMVVYVNETFERWLELHRDMNADCKGWDECL